MSEGGRNAEEENWSGSIRSNTARRLNELSLLIKREFSEQYNEFHIGKKDYKKEAMKPHGSFLLLTVAVLTFIISFLHSWIHYYFLSKTKLYHLISLAETVILFFVLHVVLVYERKRQKLNLFQWHGISKFSKARLVFFLHVLVICISVIDARFATTNGGGSEFYQVSIVLAVPAVIVWNNFLLNKQIQGFISTALCCTVAVQLIIFCKDREFSSPVSTTLCSLLFAIIVGLYLALLKGLLDKESILQITYLLVFLEMPLHLSLAVFQGESDHLFSAMVLNFKDLFKSLATCFLLAMVSFLKMALMLLLMKITDPLSCLVTMNLSLIPFTLIKVFIFKLELYLATFKWFFFLLSNVIINVFNNRVFVRN